MDTNQHPRKHEILEQMLEHTRSVHDQNVLMLTELDNQMKRMQTTKSWKAMLLLRRINEQLLKGSSAERSKFYLWVKNRFFKKPISKELELSRFSPFPEIKIRDLEDLEARMMQLLQDRDGEFTTSETDIVTSITPTGLDIFRFPVIEWDFRWQRPQQISVQFADHGHRVFYFSIDTLGLEEGDLSYEQVGSKVLIRKLQSNVWNVKLCSFNPLNAYRDSIVEPIDLKYLSWSLRFVKERFHIGPTVSILDLPFWAPLASTLDDNQVIYDCMDDHSGFSTNSSQMLSAEESLEAMSDLVITSSQRLFDRVRERNESTILLRNAGEYTHFSQPPAQLAEELRDVKGPVIGYYGAISEWFDIQLVEKLARRRKNWTFVLVGNTFGCDISRVAELDNVILTGEKPYSTLPEYLHRFDVCLIPFLVNNLTLATNPVKVYEYMAAGKPVVSSRLPELEMLGELVYLASTVDDFERMIDAALKKDHKSAVEARKEFALANSWNARFQVLEQEIYQRFYPSVSIVIVTYNNWSYTKQCLESLFKNSEHPNLEIIVVDNNSSDETRIQLSRIRHPRLKVILSPVNTGFAGGNAIGCQSSTGDTIILLNNDTIVPKGWVKRLIRPLQENPEIGIVGPMSNSVGNDQMLDFFRGDPFNGPDLNWLDEFYQLYQGRIRETDMLGFYCVAFKREVYEKIGDLDTGYGIGMFEDDDYCERIREAGYRLAIVEDAFVYHHGSVSFKKLEDAKYRETWERNKRYFERKWNKSWQFPKPPATQFLEAVDAKTTAVALQRGNKRTALILGDKDWTKDPVRWRKLAISLVNENYLVISYVHLYQGKEIEGTRKLGHSLYLTNQLELFHETEFDLVLYCGETDMHSGIKGKRMTVDRDSYEESVFIELQTKLAAETYEAQGMEVTGSASR